MNSRRKFIQKLTLEVGATAIGFSGNARLLFKNINSLSSPADASSYQQPHSLGIWQKDEYGLPVFNYTGKLPYKLLLQNGKKVKLPADPWFLLGNYRFTLFAHVSGEYELITGQRAWGRINQGDVPNSGLNNAFIDVLDKNNKIANQYLLTGVNSLAANPEICERTFGCGFASYNYKTAKLDCKRILSVKPSTNPYNGLSAFMVTVSITNKTSGDINLSYMETVIAHYEMMQQQHAPAEHKTVKYVNVVSANSKKDIIKADIKGVADDPLLFPDKEAISFLDGYPPSLFMKALTKGVVLTNKNETDKDKLSANINLYLKPGEEKTVELIIGYSFEKGFDVIDKMCDEMQSPQKDARPVNKYGNEWRKILPSFSKENDAVLKDELVWHAYILEAMATYNQFYEEAEIPQGTVYDYNWGIHASARDHLQHALGVLHYNPLLAKSVLKYAMKKTTAWGEIKLIESGYGVANNYSYFTSDQQLYFFLLLSEYLSITGDHAFLNEKIALYPAKETKAITVLQVVENCFKFLRDEIGTGEHGLVRLMNSDWNDSVFYIVNAPYNRVLYKGESHMNSAMVCVIFNNLVPQLQIVLTKPGFAAFKPKIETLTKSMELFANKVQAAFMKELGLRTFSKRMYFNDKSYGDENMFLEPQGFMMQMKNLSLKQKQTLLEQLKQRMYKGEKLGARQQEMPEFEDAEFDKGSRENGGFWYALNGPVIIGVAAFDKQEAMQLLKNMTFNNYAKSFPQYWSSYWSASDNVESSLIPEEGLPDQSNNYSDIPVFCAHPHAWLLYCYNKIISS